MSDGKCQHGHVVRRKCTICDREDDLAEIERLKAEYWKADKEAKEFASKWAEALGVNERLERDLNHMCGVADIAMNERERLRAALELIARGGITNADEVAAGVLCYSSASNSGA